MERYDASHVDVSLLTDDELYDLYLCSLGLKSTSGEGESRSAVNRVLTLCDALLYAFLIVGFGNLSWLLLIPLMLSLFGVPAGLFALVERMRARELAASERARYPSRDTVDVRSVRVLADVAQYLADPLINGSRTLQMRIREERSATARMLEKTMQARTSLLQHAGSLLDPSLKKAYEDRLLEADRISARLTARVQDLVEQEHKVQQESAVLEEQVSQLTTLAKAQHELALVQNQLGDAGEREREVALECFANLRANMEMARENLARVAQEVRSSEAARAEVEQLSLNSS